MTKKRILVGGGAGYIGSSLVPALVAAGHNVEVVDLLWFGNYLSKDVKVTQKDLLDLTVDDLKGFDQFIFLGGLSTDGMAEHSPSKNFIMNAALPAYLAFLSKNAGVKRFIYASSSSIYGYTHDKFYDENSPTISKYPYAISKLQGESGVMQMADKDFSVISYRQGTVSGFSPRMRMDLVVNAMFKSAILEQKITINNPTIWRPIYDLRDCLTSYMLAIEAPENISGVFNVASKNYQVKEIAEAVKSVIEPLIGKSIALETKHFEDFRNYAMDIEKVKKELGFKPAFVVEDIVKDLYEHKEQIGDLNNDNYYNIRIFQKIVQKEEVYKKFIADIDKFKY
jgi:nucleoside-diphosphate-sugar epimerase